MPSLIIRIGGTAPWEVPLDRPETVLGRSQDCEVPLEDDGVSRQHACFHLSGGKVQVEDLESRNGTFVEGERIERRALRPGDRVRLGSNVEVELVGDEERPRRGSGARESGRSGAGRPARSRAAAPPRAGGGPLMRTEWVLIPEEPGGRKHAIPLKSRVVTVGRKGSANLAIEDESVSRLHARFDREGEALYVTDLKSRNGTFVNDEPAMRAALEDGDIVTFGSLPFAVRRRTSFAWERLAIGLGVVVALVGLGFAVVQINDALVEKRTVSEAKPRLKRQALGNIERGIAAYRQGDVDYARGYLMNAADMVLYLDLAPPGASMAKPAEVFRSIAAELPPEDREFDFDQAFQSAVPAGLETLTNREYVARRVRAISIELGLDQEAPQGFIDQVWNWVDQLAAPRGGFQTRIDRSAQVMPQMRAIMAESRLPEIFCYVAWNESGLNLRARSHVGAYGLWQFMPATAREYGLRIDGPDDERTDVTRSTQAATRMISDLIKVFGREQFMCALACYNRGPGGIMRAMRKIPDPMMEASKKYWYLVENGLIPQETSDYVPRIVANMIIAENPERFGLRRAGAAQ